MRASVSFLLALLVAGAALAQMGPEMMGGMGGMGGMGFAPPSIVDIGPAISPDGKTVIFSRVTASKQGEKWSIAPIQGGMMGGGMGMEGGMMPGGMGPEGMGMGMGMGMGGPKLDAEGLIQVPINANGKPGAEKTLIQGRAVVQDAAGGSVCYAFQGKGAADYAQWGVWGINFGGGGNARWYPAPQPFPWVRVSPNGKLFAVPYDPAKAIVFFPAKANAQQNAGYVQIDDRKTPANWVGSSDGVWIVKEDKPQQQGGGMMGGGMMPGGMGPEMMGGMGGMGGMGIAIKYHIAKAGIDQKITEVVKDVAKGSKAISIPKSTDIAVSMGKKQAGGMMMGGAAPAASGGGLYIYSADGQEKSTLSTRKAIDMAASPNGKYIAFTWAEKGPLNLSVAPLDGRPVRGVAMKLIGGIGGCRAFAWSADSRKIAYAAEHHNGNGVFIVDIETGKTERISTAPAAQTPGPAGGAGGG